VDWCKADGHIVHSPDGCSGGIGGHGSCDALAARGDERGISLGADVEGAMREMVRRVEEEELDL